MYKLKKSDEIRKRLVDKSQILDRLKNAPVTKWNELRIFVAPNSGPNGFPHLICPRVLSDFCL